MTTEIDIAIKQKIAATVKADRTKYATDAAHALKLGVDKAQYSRVFNKNELTGVLGAGSWVSIAMILNLQLKREIQSIKANTPTYDTIYTQLEMCQGESKGMMFCDSAGIGKTYTAEQYEAEHENVALIDCSQYSTARTMMRCIASRFGLASVGITAKIRERISYYINNFTTTPLIILDEAGDMKRDAILEIKALWNATKGNCGWYLMGAEGFKKMFDTGRDNERVGFTELFDRFGANYQMITTSPQWRGDVEGFNHTQTAIYIKANLPDGYDPQVLVNKSLGSLRRAEALVIGIKLNQLNQSPSDGTR